MLNDEEEDLNQMKSQDKLFKAEETSWMRDEVGSSSGISSAHLHESTKLSIFNIRHFKKKRNFFLSAINQNKKM
jgi:hypothetical protein